MSKTNSWVRLRKNDSNLFDLPCIRDSRNMVLKVFDLKGKELEHNAASRMVKFNGVYYYY